MGDLVMKILTKQDLNVVKAFQKHTYISQSKPIIILLALIFVFAILCCVTGNYSTGGALIFVEIFFIIFYPLALYSANNKLNKSYKGIQEDKMIEYEFSDGFYTVRSFVNGEEVESSKSDYSKIYKVDETSDYVFVYIANNMAHCISKKDISSNDVETLKSMMTTHNVKYKISKR